MLRMDLVLLLRMHMLLLLRKRPVCVMNIDLIAIFIELVCSSARSFLEWAIATG
jgi:hypothetical protein